MNPEPADDLIERIAAVSVALPADPLDVDEAIRTGTRRRRGRQVAVAVTGAFAAVLAVTGSVYVIRSFDQRADLTTAGPPLTAPVVTADQLAGRWIGVDVDAHDISSWRDASGLPANIIIGADQAPDTWRANRSCGPLVAGTFAVKAGGSFTFDAPPPSFQSCPMATSVAPDLPGAIVRTVHVEVDPAGSDPRTLRFLDGAGQRIASWREDVTIRSAASWCHTALGAQAVYTGGFTTVEEARAKAAAAFPDVPGGAVAVYCTRVEQAATVTYAVTAEGQKAKL
jgi:hypothetical protein